MAIELEDGTIIRSLPEQVSYNDERIEEQGTRLTTLEARVAAALAGVFHYKGSVATYGDLPATDNEVGDVWNVIDTGKNYAWSGSSWDDLGGIVDLSNLVTLDTVQTITGQKTFTADVNINGMTLRDRGGELAIGDAYGDFLVIGQDTTCQTNFIPYNDNTYDLGRSTYKWKQVNAYTINLGSSGVLTYDNGAFSINDNLIPDTNDTNDLGSSTNKFKDLHLSGKAYASSIELANNGFLRCNNTNVLQFSSYTMRTYSFFPFVSSSYDIGSSSYKYKNLWMTGNLNDGTNSVTIADLAALIAYAKAQGWIS